MFNQEQLAILFIWNFLQNKGDSMVKSKTNVSLLGFLISANIIKHLYSTLCLGKFQLSFSRLYVSQISYEMGTIHLVYSLCTEREFISQRTKINFPQSLHNLQEQTVIIHQLVPLHTLDIKNRPKNTQARSQQSFCGEERKLKVSNLPSSLTVASVGQDNKRVCFLTSCFSFF